MNFSQSEENYLKSIFHLGLKTGTVTTSALALELDAKPASITDMMKKLSAKGLLHYKPYYGFFLSAEGKKAALGIIRRHRLWEYFLSEKLGFTWNEVHAVAEELEHVSNKKLIDKLDEFLGFPQFDPHGDPIPDSRGRLKQASSIILSDLPPNQPAKILQVTTQTNELLQHLKEKGLSIGATLEIRKIFPFDRSLQIKTRTGTILITSELAQNLFVKKI